MATFRNSARILKKLQERFPKAFTLVELIVVITILAILATVGFLTLSGYTDDARSATVAANVRTVYSAILTESTTSGNSPRYYVDHDPAAALSGGIVFVDGNPVALTGGQWGSGGTNYSAGNPRWDRLKMNGDKFRLSAVFRGMLGTAGFADPVQAAYDTGAVSVGAFDYVGKAGVSGKARTAAYFQVAGVSPGTKKASVTGNYTAVGTGAVAGLVKDPGSSSSTGAVVDGSAITNPVSNPDDPVCGVNRSQTKWDNLASGQWVCFEDQWGDRIAVWKLANVGAGGNMWDPNKIYTRDAGSSVWTKRTYYGSSNRLNCAWSGYNNDWIEGCGYNWGEGGSYPSNGANCNGQMLVYCNNCSTSAVGWTVEAPNTPYGNSYGWGVGMCYVPTNKFGFMKTVYTQQ